MKLSATELESKTILSDTLQFAVEQIKANGYIIFESVFSKEKVNQLHLNFMKVFAKFTAKNALNRGKSRTQMHMPFMEPFIDPEVITNPFALAVVDALLGNDCACRYFASDTPLPGSEFQHIHADGPHLYEGFSQPLPPYSLVLNIPLVEFRQDNGPMEIWPGGTHHTYIKPDQGHASTLLERLKTDMLSERVLMPAGSLLIRDTRMWHRGTPNRSTEPRPNLALIFNRHWYGANQDISIPQETYDHLSKRGKQLFRFEKIGGSVLEY